MNENEQPAFWPAQGNLHQGRVFVLKEDVIFTVLAQEGGIAWMNARHPHSGGSFIIATAVSDEEEERATRLLKNEFALRDVLQDSWAIRAVASTQYRGRFALVYAPFSFELLARRAGRAISGIARFIELAIQICVPPAPDASAKPDPRRYQTRQYFCLSRCHLPSGQLWSLLPFFRCLLADPSYRFRRYPRLDVAGTYHPHPAPRRQPQRSLQPRHGAV